MVFKIFDSNGYVNTIESSEAFCDFYCRKHGYAYEAVEVPDPEPVVEEPTQLDRIEAQVTYTAMMTDTLLEG